MKLRKIVLNCLTLCLLFSPSMWLMFVLTRYEENVHLQRPNKIQLFQVVAEQHIGHRNDLPQFQSENSNKVFTRSQKRFRTRKPTRDSMQSFLELEKFSNPVLQIEIENNVKYSDDNDNKLSPRTVPKDVLTRNLQTDARKQKADMEIERNLSMKTKFQSSKLKMEKNNASQFGEMESVLTQNQHTETPTKTGVHKAAKAENLNQVFTEQKHVSKNLSRGTPKVLLIIAVVTAPGRLERRNTIRQTWMSKYRSSKQVICKFFTDKFVKSNSSLEQLQRENELNKDMEFLPLSEGIHFGMRLLLTLKWAKMNYEFSYFLRIDDDYFLCIDRLQQELSQLQMSKFIRGYMHCKYKATRVDEGWMLLSNALIQSFLSREDSLLCHAFGDQQVALWLNDEKNCEIFHDFRIHHHPPAKEVRRFQNNPFVCQEYIAIHGAYPSQMLTFWNASLQSGHSLKSSENLLTPSQKYCPYNGIFDWRFIGSEESWYRLPPKPCRENPSWNLNGISYLGRQRT